MARGDGMPFMSIAVAKWLCDTQELSLEEQGLLMRALAHSWRLGALPKEHDRLARLLGVTPRQLTKLWRGLTAMFEVTDFGMVSQELEREFSRASRSKAARRAGAAATNAKRHGPPASPANDAAQDAERGAEGNAERSGSESPSYHPHPHPHPHTSHAGANGHSADERLRLARKAKGAGISADVIRKSYSVNPDTLIEEGKA
jgi:uncharacterized protein YdaU (DUF1376 family)